MKFALLITMMLGMLVGMITANAACPAGLTAFKGTLCASKRPVHGTCPELTRYDVNENMCIYVARN